ncbi:MAG: branched-chain amino acid ABC transporter permease [Haloglomus sp.]
MALLTGWAAFIVTILTLAVIYALLTIGLNVHFGYTGLINFGHVAFFTIGAYVSAILTMPPPTQMTGVKYTFGLNLPMPAGFAVSLALAAVAGGLLAALLGLTSIRLGGHYLAIVTFALAGIFKDVVVNEAWLTNGPFGLNSVPKPGQAALGPDLWQLSYLGLSVLILLGTLAVVTRLVGSPFGRLLKGIRENEDAARTLGKDTNRVKLKSFALGGAIAGLAGGVYAHYVGAVVPQQFVPEITFTVWTAMLLGGAASSEGAIFGAALLVGFRESTRFLLWLYDGLLDVLPGVAAALVRAAVAPLPDHPSFIPSIRFAVIGLLLVLVIRYRPEGVFGDPSEIESIGEER